MLGVIVMYLISFPGSLAISSLSPAVWAGQAGWCLTTTRGLRAGTAKAATTGVPPSSWQTSPGTTRRYQPTVRVDIIYVPYSWLSQQLRKHFLDALQP